MGWSVTTTALAAFSVWLVSATTKELNLAAQVPPKPKQVIRDIVVRDAPDSSGRVASFRILLFSDEFRWRLNSVNRIEDGSAQPFFSPEMKEVLSEAEEIICVGASSEEVPAGASFDQGRALEERRAARRAEQIASWVRSVVSKPVPVRKLNVGHHEPTDGIQDTSDQRRVVIILVLDQDKDTNLDEALREAMARESRRAPIFETLLTRYSLSSGDSFTWVP
jgi:hypothetical protein